MKDNKLISMTDFVLEQYKEKVPKGFNEHISDALDFEKKCIRYAKFLKQPLKLEMFVPCDEEGKPWIYPPTQEEKEWAQRDSADAEQSYEQKVFLYQQAKDKVLFEGFTYYKDKEYVGSDRTLINVLDIVDGGMTIEDLMANKKSFFLTKTALKEIYG